jgi:hypothetical protein
VLRGQGAVAIEREDMRVTGEGLELNSAVGYLAILNRARVEIRRAPAGTRGGGK